MTDDDARSPDVPPIPGPPLDPPLPVPEAVSAVIRLAGESSAALNGVRDATPWAAPEVLDGRSPGSGASDVYSLGSVLWHLLVGRPPFWLPDGDNSPRGLTARILHSTPPPTQRPDAPPALEALLARALSKAPEQRPGSRVELARALQIVESDAGYPTTPIADLGEEAAVTPVESVSGAIPREAAVVPDLEEAEESGTPTWRSPALWWSVAGVVVVVVVVLVVKMLADAPAALSPPQPGPAARRSPHPPGRCRGRSSPRVGTALRWTSAGAPPTYPRPATPTSGRSRAGPARS